MSHGLAKSMKLHCYVNNMYNMQKEISLKWEVLNLGTYIHKGVLFRLVHSTKNVLL